jgi:hypothetical protein
VFCCVKTRATCKKNINYKPEKESKEGTVVCIFKVRARACRLPLSKCEGSARATLRSHGHRACVCVGCILKRRERACVRALCALAYALGAQLWLMKRAMLPFLVASTI